MHFCELHAQRVLATTPPISRQERDVRIFSLSTGQSPHVVSLNCSVPVSVISLIPEEVAVGHCIVPVALCSERLVIAATTEFGHNDWDMIRFIANHRIGLIVATYDSITEAIKRAYS